jgi:hypothetical protein
LAYTDFIEEGKHAMRNFDFSPTLLRTIALAATVTAGVTAAAAAQTTAGDPNHSATMVAQEDTAGQGQGVQPTQPGMMGTGMMGGMMQPGMMGSMPMMGMRQIMKVMFAVADVNGDGGLSFEEVTLIHKRIFDKVDANKDGKVTTEEVQLFMRD